jgi:hypothetical protein
MNMTHSRLFNRSNNALKEPLKLSRNKAILLTASKRLVSPISEKPPYFGTRKPENRSTMPLSGQIPAIKHWSANSKPASVQTNYKISAAFPYPPTPPSASSSGSSRTNLKSAQPTKRVTSALAPSTPGSSTASTAAPRNPSSSLTPPMPPAPCS